MGAMASLRDEVTAVLDAVQRIIDRVNQLLGRQDPAIQAEVDRLKVGRDQLDAAFPVVP